MRGLTRRTESDRSERRGGAPASCRPSPTGGLAGRPPRAGDERGQATSRGVPDPDAPDLRLVLPAVAAWVVAWQARVLPVWPVVGIAAALVVAAALLLWRGSAGWTVVTAAVLVCAAAAGVATTARTASRSHGPLASLAARGAAVRAVAVLTDDPHLAATPGARGQPLVVARVRVEELSAGAEKFRLRAPVLVLSSDPAWLTLLPSQRVQVGGTLKAAATGDDVAALLSARGPPVVLGPPSRVQRIAGRLRAGLRAAVAPLPNAEAGLLPGLVVGDVSRLDPEVRESFRTVGLTHLTAVSGSNVAITLAAVLALCGWIGVGRRARPVVGGLALVGFVVLARPSPSVLRAGAMGLVGLLALATGGRRRAVPALAATVLLLVLVSPDLAASAGFALSVLATAGLLVLAPPWRAALARRLPPLLADALAVPAAAQLACGPVIVAISGQLGLLSVPANLLAVPAVAPATVVGVLAALVAPLCLPAAQALAWVGWLPTAWLVLIGRVGAALPGAAVPWPAGGEGALLLVALTVVGALVLRRPALRRAVLASVVAAGIAVGTVRSVSPAWPPADWLFVACDVGQGDALVLAAGPGSAVVVDSGPDPGAVDGCLDRLGVHQVPLLVLSHEHADHVDGLAGVLRGRSVGAVEVGPLDEPAAQFRDVRRLAGQAGVPLVRAGLGEVRQVGAARLTVLGPSHTYRGTRSDPNNSSIVLLVEIRGVRLLLTGDAEPEAQDDLLASGQDLHADVLKTPHHGSDHQDPRFLAAVQARVAVTSVGAGNSYGHPSARTLRWLGAGGAPSLRTDLDGDVAVALVGGRLVAVGSRGSDAGPPRPP